MSIKNLFANNKALTSEKLQDSTLDYEDSEYNYVHVTEREKFEPYVDYSDPRNFCFYGLASMYYEDAFNRISNSYPYDGSTTEKKLWHLSSSNFDNYIFEDVYPRTTGYIHLGLGIDEGSTATYNSKNYASASSPEYINVRQLMNTGSYYDGGMSSLKTGFSGSNKYKVGKNRDSNLEFNLNDGITLEFWFKHGAQIVSPTETLFDLWNGETSGTFAEANADYGRFTLETTGSISGTVNFLLTAQSGTTGIYQTSAGSSTDIQNWHHYALRAHNTGSDLRYELYIDGELNSTQTATSQAINNVTGSLKATIGALQESPSGSTNLGLGWGSISGSLDEFRFWKNKRTHQDIGRFYFTNIEAGTNKYDAETNLGFYYKFNEGVTQRPTIDSIVLDYSGRTTNGDWVNYVSGSRNTGSAIVSASAAEQEFQDPIIWNFHPTVEASKTFHIQSGSSYDFQNNASLFNSIPNWILEEDQGQWKKLSQIVGSYFDNVQLLTKEVPKLRNIQYTSGSDKPYTLAPNLLSNIGVDPVNLFNDASRLELLYNRDEDREFEETLSDIKNKIFLNIYNNIADLYKQKGTIKALRNVFHCFGIDENLININVYADNQKYDIRKTYRIESIKKKFVDFNNIDRFNATIFQQTSSANPYSTGYIYGSGVNKQEKSVPITIESLVLFPKKPDRSLNSWASSSFTRLTSSLFGFHTPITGSDIDDTAWETGSIADMQVYAVRDLQESDNIRFVLRSSTEGNPLPTLTSSFFEEVYDNQKWNVAVRVSPSKRENAGLALGATSGSNTYNVEFYGVSTVLGAVLNEFSVTGTMDYDNGSAFVSAPKRMYAGAYKTNFTGSTIQSSDVKIGSLRYWNTYLTDTTIKEHNIDPENYGNNASFTDLYRTIDSLSFKEINDSELLALDWSFDTITGSTSDGDFIIEDITSGSADFENRYDWIGNIVGKEYTGQGYGFPSSDTTVVDNSFLDSGKYRTFENLNSEDMVTILESDRVEQIQDARPVNYVISLEKSLYNSISEEMIEWLGTVEEYNNLLGEPIAQYHMEYKGLEQLRKLFFEHVENTPSFERFVELYKWIDTSLSSLVSQFVPASAAGEGRIRTVIESHAFERSKIWNKLPTTQYVNEQLEGTFNTVNSLLNRWSINHHPISNNEADHQNYWKFRASRTSGQLSSGDTEVDASRATIYSASLSALNRSYSTVYNLDAERDILDGENTKYQLYRNVNSDSGKSYIWTTNNSTFDERIYGLKDVNDVLDPTVRERYQFRVNSGKQGEELISADLAFPFKIYSASVSGGVHDYIITQLALSADFGNNLHNEYYGNFNQNPAQGPFTQHVAGGFATHRQQLNDGTDNVLTRTENKYVILEPDNKRLAVYSPETEQVESDAAGNADIDVATWPKERYTRDLGYKSVHNVRNVQQTTSSRGTIIGNYSNTYEYLQVGSRRDNNYWLRDQTGSVQATPEVSTLRRTEEEQYENFELPDRSQEDGNNQKTAMVTRFSSPGEHSQISRGFLDTTSETISIYSTLNYRNLNVKKYIQDVIYNNRSGSVVSDIGSGIRE